MQQQEQPHKPQPAKPQQQQEEQQHKEEEQQQQQQDQEQGESFFGAAGRLPTLLGSSHGKPSDEEKAEAKAASRSSSGLSLPHLLPGKSRSSPAAAEAEAEEKPAEASSSDGNMLGALVQKIVAGFDDSLLGVKVHIDSMKLEPLSGAVEVRGLKVDNPKGFRSKYLLHADKVVLRVNMTRLVSSLGGTVEVDEIDLDNVDVIYEKALTTSNLKTLLQKLEGAEQGGKGGKPKPSGQDESSLHLALHKIAVRNVGAKVCTSLSAMAGPRLSVGDIHYEDFDKTSGGARGLMHVVQLVLATLLKSILASILGKSASDGVARAASGVTHTFSNAFHKSKTALSHIRPHGATDGEAVAAAEVQPPARTWCGYAAPWSCCQGVAHEEEGEIEVSQ